MEKIKTDYNRRRSSFNTCLKLMLIGLSIFSCQVTQGVYKYKGRQSHIPVHEEDAKFSTFDSMF